MSLETHKAKTTLIVHHNADMDGIMSGLVAARTMKIIQNNISSTYVDDFAWHLVGYNYGKDPEIDPWLKLVNDAGDLLFDHIQFIDIIPPLEFIERCIPFILKNQLTIYIFDHHHSAYVEIHKMLNEKELNPDEMIRYFFNPKYCGAFIYWDSIVNYTNWLFETYGFLMGYEEGIEDPVTEVKWYQKPFGSKPKPKVGEYFTLKNRVTEEIKHHLNTNTIYDFLSLVSKYDTWAWYNEDQSKRDFSALELNEAFMDLFLFTYFEDISDFYEFMFTDKHFNDNLNYFIQEGKKISKEKMKLASQNKHELIHHNGWNFAALKVKANYYDTENIKLQYNNIGKNIDIVIYYHTSLATGLTTLSLRGVNPSVNCIDAVKSLTDGNGGGHFSATGGQTSFINLSSKFEELIFVEPEDINNHHGGHIVME